MNTEPESGLDAGTVDMIPAETAAISTSAAQSPATDTEAPVEPTAAQAAPSSDSQPVQDVPGFDSMGLSPSLLQAITEAGYKTPTPIQAQGIPYALQRRDLIGIAQTGTGKTASFALPMIELLSRGRAKARMPRSLILEPTRELAAQVAESFDQYTKYNKLSMALLIGGVSFEEQDRKLDRGADILIATPGRLMDHFERGKLMLSQVQILVVDEADRMLDMGFIPDVERICKLIPFTRQTLFYSATMPTEIRRLTEQFLQNPARIEVARPATTASNIVQMLVDVPANDWAKREALRRLIIEAGEIKNAIVFCNRKHDVDIVARSLKKHGFNAAPLHGDLDQSLRTKTLDAFRSGELQLLVASDVAARGLDIPDVSHVFNFDVPFHSDDYVHRIGRTGRAGRHGAAFMLVTPRDRKYVDDIEKLTKTTLERRVLEGLAEAVQERPARPNRDTDRRGGRDRGRDRNKRDYPVKPHGQVAAMEPAKQTTEETQVQRQPQRHQEARRDSRPDNRPDNRQDNRLENRQENRQPQRPQNHETRGYDQQSRQPYGQQGSQQQNKNRQNYRDYNRREWLEPEKPDISQLPAFLLRPVPLPKLTEKKPVEKPVKKAVQTTPVTKPPVTQAPVTQAPVTQAPKPTPKPEAGIPAETAVVVAPVTVDVVLTKTETPVAAPVEAALGTPPSVAPASAPETDAVEKPKKPRARRAPRKKAVEADALGAAPAEAAQATQGEPVKKKRVSRPRKKAAETAAPQVQAEPAVAETATKN